MSNQKLINFFSLWIASSVVFLAASMALAGHVVLGNDKVSTPMAAVISGFVLVALMTVVAPAMDRSGYKIKSQMGQAVIYLVFNLVVLWVLKRFALVLGLGISSLMYVVILGVVLTLVQWGVVAATGSMTKSKGRK